MVLVNIWYLFQIAFIIDNYFLFKKIRLKNYSKQLLVRKKITGSQSVKPPDARKTKTLLTK